MRNWILLFVGTIFMIIGISGWGNTKGNTNGGNWIAVRSGNWEDEDIWKGERKPDTILGNGNKIVINDNVEVVVSNLEMKNNTEVIIGEGAGLRIGEDLGIGNNWKIEIGGWMIVDYLELGKNGELSGGGKIWARGSNFIHKMIEILEECDDPNSVFFPGDSVSYIDLERSPVWEVSEFHNTKDKVTNQLTVAAWVKWRSGDPAGDWANIVTYNNPEGDQASGDDGMWWLQHNENNKKFEFAIKTDQTNNARSYVFSDIEPEVGKWYHVVGIYNGDLDRDQLQIYVNGDLQRSKNRSGDQVKWNSGFELNIGRWSNASNNHRFFNGHIIDVNVWKRALTPIEIYEIAINSNNSDGIDSTDSDLMGWWELDNIGSDNVVWDNSQRNVHGLLMGAAQSDCTTEPDINDILPPVGLPIELNWFNGEEDVNGVVLTWESLTETNNDYYTIQWSTDGNDWVDIGTLNGMGTKSTPTRYELFHDTPIAGINYYRLSQTDFDGKGETFQPIVVRVEEIRNWDWNWDGNTLEILGEWNTISVYTIEGTLVWKGERNKIQLESGIWIIVIDNQATKLLLK